MESATVLLTKTLVRVSLSVEAFLFWKSRPHTVASRKSFAGAAVCMQASLSAVILLGWALGLAICMCAWFEDGSIGGAGEDVGHYGGSYKVSYDLHKKYGDLRLLDTPICGASPVHNLAFLRGSAY